MRFKLNKGIKALVIIVVSIGVVGILYDLARRNLAPTDSNALLGGQLESGYRATGFLVNYQTSGGIEYCGMTVIGRRTAITAAHCLDVEGDKFIGFDQFTLDQSVLIPVTSFKQKDGWDRQSSNNDIAVLDLGVGFGSAPTLAQLRTTEPPTGCRYRVVAYGRTESDFSKPDRERPRKSALLCLNNILGNVLVMYSGEGGICLGDSGSAVYEESTNRLIGVISAVKKANNSDPFCFIGNTAFITRVDTAQNFIVASSHEDVFANNGQSSSNSSTSIASGTNSSLSGGNTSLPNTADGFFNIVGNTLTVGSLSFNLDEVLPLLVIMIVVLAVIAIVLIAAGGKKEETMAY